ncbi:hypothetical protein [Thermovenabulum sp.]|uniref:hypothetical protein n=1 Tax=Thermovenabulum sp. TaxID=3100335 RepID=UPI003C7B5BBA
MIYIDDAGSGSLIGGVCIGFYHKEKDFFYYDLIPVEFFNDINFKEKEYQKFAVNIVKKFFHSYGVNKKEEIFVCRGYIFDKVREYLSMNGYNFKSIKIEGKLQTEVENAFSNHIVSLGLPKDYIIYTKYPFHFHKLLKWVFADYENRIKLCKTGWKSWKKYGAVDINISYGILPADNNFICLKCGKKILKNSPVKILRFFTNRENTVFLHKNCP